MPTGGSRDAAHYVLLVEDDVAVREAIAELLHAVGYPVVTASNGGEALELLVLHGPPALILLDLIMPVMAGWEFLQEFERRGWAEAIPVIAISAMPSGAEPPGLAGFLLKPFTYEQLLEVVEAHIGGGGVVSV